MYMALAHGILTGTMDIEKFEEIINTILQETKPFLLTADIKSMGWLTRRPPNKAVSSIIMEFTTPKGRKVDEKVVAWIANFLEDRYKQIVRVGHTSVEYAVEMGMPQGWPLFPIFSIFHNLNIIDKSDRGNGTATIGYIQLRKRGGALRADTHQRPRGKCSGCTKNGANAKA
jgi:hypothetical protein